MAGAVIGLLILPRTGALLWQTVNVLLEGVPPHLDVTEIGLAMAEAPGVLRVHDLHVWARSSSSGGTPASSDSRGAPEPEPPT